MNSDTCETAEQLAREAGAIKPCSICGDDLHAEDGKADQMTYARATNAWKSGVRGFRSMPREEVMDLVKSVLDDAPITCSCL